MAEREVAYRGGRLTREQYTIPITLDDLEDPDDTDDGMDDADDYDIELDQRVFSKWESSALYRTIQQVSKVVQQHVIVYADVTDLMTGLGQCYHIPS